MTDKYLYCPFCKLTKTGRSKAYSYFEYLDHLTESHSSEFMKKSGKVIFTNDLKAIIHTLAEHGVIKKK